MQILLKNLKITQFKGIKNFELTTHGNETTVLGANGLGKSSIFDAFCWLLFGKDSSDRTDFNIKTLDENGKTTDRAETEVSALLSVDGMNVTLKRVFRENWVRPRGKLEAEFAGNETAYFYNDVPLKQSEYKAKIEIMVDEKLFKLLTNPLYFNQLKWQEHRTILSNMVPPLPFSTIVSRIETPELSNEIQNLINNLNQNKTLDHFRKEIAVKKKLAKDELTLIPARIDEQTRSIPAEIPVYSEIEKEIQDKQEKINAIDNDIMNQNKAIEGEVERISKLRMDKSRMESDLIQVRNSSKQESINLISDKRNQLQNIQNKIQNNNTKANGLQQSINQNNHLINTYQEEQKILRADWEKENSSTIKFDDEISFCPTCKREFDSDKLEQTKSELTENFNNAKAKKLDGIKNRGLTLTELINKLKSQNSVTEHEISVLNTEIDALQQEQESIKAEIETIQSSTQEIPKSELELNLEKQIAEFVIPEFKTPDFSELKKAKDNLQTDIDILKSKLSVKSRVAEINKRIEDLSEQERVLAQQLANYEKQEFVIEKFNSENINYIEQTVNSKFKYVNFKMFNTQVNGGLEETCETTYLGVPFSDLNTAGKIFAGIDIINGLSAHYNVTAPMFLDNRESTIDIPATDSQVINLVVSKEHKSLTIQ